MFCKIIAKTAILSFIKIRWVEQGLPRCCVAVRHSNNSMESWISMWWWDTTEMEKGRHNGSARHEMERNNRGLQKQFESSWLITGRAYAISLKKFGYAFIWGFSTFPTTRQHKYIHVQHYTCVMSLCICTVLKITLNLLWKVLQMER